MIDVAGTELDDTDRKRLRHPQVGGVILFSRNYENPAQLTQLCREIHALRDPRLVVAVDQEGGRVQRFREGFQAIPAMGHLGDLYDDAPHEAIRLAEIFAWVMASELLFYGIDLSFSPVLDIANPISSVIGDRAFHRDPETVCHLANAWIRGMRRAGMEAVGKHFPGHGSVEGDSHHVMPFDRRSFLEIEALDLVPFRRVIATHLSGIMMAHVIYDRVDSIAAGYSRFWIESVLRGWFAITRPVPTRCWIRCRIIATRRRKFAWYACMANHRRRVCSKPVNGRTPARSYRISITGWAWRVAETYLNNE
jgi:beta-N-acetylhexosaminidase